MDRHATVLARATIRRIRRANEQQHERVERLTVERNGERIQTTTRDHGSAETR